MLTLRPMHVGFGVAEQPLGRRVERFDAPVRVDDDDAVDGGFDDRAPARLAGAQLLFERTRAVRSCSIAGELPLAADRHLADRQVQREGRAVATAAGDLAADADDPLARRSPGTAAR